MPAYRKRPVQQLLDMSRRSGHAPTCLLAARDAPHYDWRVKPPTRRPTERYAGERVQVEITPCGERFCGQIVWLNSLDDPRRLPLVDLKNSDPALRTRPLLGLIVLRDLRRADARTWVDGKIYNPVDGKDYSALMSIQKDGSLRVRAYVLHPLIGQTQLWSRVS